MLEKLEANSYSQELAAAERELKNIERRKSKVFELYETDIISADNLNRRIQQINKEQEEKERRRDELRAHLSGVAKQKAMLKKILKALPTFRENYESANFKQRKAMVQSLVHKITVYPDGNVDLTVNYPFLTEGASCFTVALTDQLHRRNFPWSPR